MSGRNVQGRSPEISRHAPFTEFGARSSSILGYAARRVVSRVRNVGTPRGLRGESHYTEPSHVDHFSEHIHYQRLHTTPDPTERQQAFLRAHHDRLEWAAHHLTARLQLHSEEGRDHYRTARQNLLLLNTRYREIYETMQNEWAETSLFAPQERNLQLGPPARERWQETRRLLMYAERVEHQWQLAGYQDLINQLRIRDRPPSSGEVRAFRKAYERYQQDTASYQASLEGMVSENLDFREHGRKKAEQRVFYSLWDLHNTVQEIYGRRDWNHGLDAPLTFSSKTQAYLIARGPNGMAGLEPFLERVWHLRHAIGRVESGTLSLPEFDHILAREFSIPMLLDYYRGLRIGAPQDFDISQPAAALVASGLGSFSDPPPHFREGMISVWPHTGSTDAAGMLGGFYLLDMPRGALVYEKAMGYAPVIRRGLAFRGVRLDRSSPEKRAELYEKMADKVNEGLGLGIFGTGTRALGMPLVSPYAPLDHPGALHLPGEFMFSRDMTGMPIRLAEKMREERGQDVPITIFSANLHRGGVAEPSMPRTLSGFLSGDQMFRYSWPQTEEGWLAYAGHLTSRTLLRNEDFSDLSPWDVLQMNTALGREMEMLSGFQMDAGQEMIDSVSPIR
ncbi:MAG: hypothetical protein A3B79_04205 [Deltaproteobacteria bacterium RIFCSPHIGHO2_02_FULL_50_15]|nr:MAG: hypothetical protein A3B79_04205 [Deltaproteobacteria bacterium RIFCSPHIGHO2_02_FULL_50_15]